MKTTKKKVLAIEIAVLIISLSLIVVFFDNFGLTSNAKATRVACIGDSITELTKYPNDLQKMLDANYIVGNFGVNASTVVFNSSRPYYFENAFKKARDFLPDIVVIMLGTNDARINVYESIDRFVKDYEKLISKIQIIKSNPKIFLVKPPPILNNTLDLNNADLLEGVIPRIEQVAKDLNLTTIDVYTPLANHPEYFPDGIHPNNEGANLIASMVYKAIISANENS